MFAEATSAAVHDDGATPQLATDTPERQNIDVVYLWMFEMRRTRAGCGWRRAAGARRGTREYQPGANLW